MKKIIIGLAFLGSISAFASTGFKCQGSDSDNKNKFTFDITYGVFMDGKVSDIVSFEGVHFDRDKIFIIFPTEAEASDKKNSTIYTVSEGEQGGFQLEVSAMKLNGRNQTSATLRGYSGFGEINLTCQQKF